MSWREPWAASKRPWRPPSLMRRRRRSTVRPLLPCWRQPGWLSCLPTACSAASAAAVAQCQCLHCFHTPSFLLFCEFWCRLPCGAVSFWRAGAAANRGAQPGPLHPDASGENRCCWLEALQAPHSIEPLVVVADSSLRPAQADGTGIWVTAACFSVPRSLHQAEVAGRHADTQMCSNVLCSYCYACSKRRALRRPPQACTSARRLWWRCSGASPGTMERTQSPRCRPCLKTASGCCVRQRHPTRWYTCDPHSWGLSLGGPPATSPAQPLYPCTLHPAPCSTML